MQAESDTCPRPSAVDPGADFRAQGIVPGALLDPPANEHFMETAGIEPALCSRRNIVVTWPKKRPLGSYLAELELAKRDGLVINYRVARFPAWADAIEDHGSTGWPYGTEAPHCYMVHDEAVRGWCEILYCCTRRDGEVRGWPAGRYIVRSPEWHTIDPIPMHGFQGWRWFDERVARGSGHRT